MKKHTIFDKLFLNNEDIEVLLPIFCYGHEIPGKTLKVVPEESTYNDLATIYLTDGNTEKEVAKIVHGAAVDSCVLYYAIETITGLKFLLDFWGDKSSIIPVIDFPKGLEYDRTFFYKLDTKKWENDFITLAKEKGIEREVLSLHNQGYDSNRIGLKFQLYKI